MQTAVIELFRPSNSDSGEAFMNTWCRHCERDKAMRDGLNVDECDDNELCQIIPMTMAFDIEAPEYPKEWCYDSEGRPQCTAFVQAGHPIPLKDELTLDMFGG